MSLLVLQRNSSNLQTCGSEAIVRRKLEKSDVSEIAARQQRIGKRLSRTLLPQNSVRAQALTWTPFHHRLLIDSFQRFRL